MRIKFNFEIEGDVSAEQLAKLSEVVELLKGSIGGEGDTKPADTTEEPEAKAKRTRTKQVTQADIKENVKAAETKADDTPAGKVYTFEEVRPAAVKISKSSEENKAAVQKLIAKHGAEKLADLDPKHYGAFMAELEKLAPVDEDI